MLKNILFILGLCIKTRQDEPYDLELAPGEQLNGWVRKAFDYNLTYFPNLFNFQDLTEPALEKDYPWVAKVLHSRHYDYPFMCTAVCIDTEIFVTAARCVYRLKILYTSIMYKSERLFPRALVVPTNSTPQLHDDIGFIVVEKTYKGNWDVIRPYYVERTDDKFEWFGNITGNFTAVGYATYKKFFKLVTPERQFSLSKLPVTVGLNLCRDVLTHNGTIFEAYRVPCYHSCSSTEYFLKDDKCNAYLGVEGCAIINDDTKELLGLATWGATHNTIILPVGIAVLNSDNYKEDFKCAQKIRSSAEPPPYQSICD